MIPFCGRCGRRFLTLDLTLVERGRARCHYVRCERWDAQWRVLRGLFIGGRGEGIKEILRPVEARP